MPPMDLRQEGNMTARLGAMERSCWGRKALTTWILLLGLGILGPLGTYALGVTTLTAVKRDREVYGYTYSYTRVNGER